MLRKICKLLISEPHVILSNDGGARSNIGNAAAEEIQDHPMES